MGAADNAVSRTRSVYSEVDMRRNNRYGYIRQLYIDELKYDSGELQDKTVSARRMKEIKRKIRARLKREARRRFLYATIFTFLIVAVLSTALYLLLNYYQG